MIRYAARVNFDVACPMDFHVYPGDVQVKESFNHQKKFCTSCFFPE
jgi:hypothetical protein